MAKVLMRLSGSKLLSNSWKQELVVTDEGVEGEVLKDFKRIKMLLPFDRIAQVNIVRGMFTADLEVVNKGGADNVVIKALNKAEAEKARTLIDQKMHEVSREQRPASSPSSVADELRKLAELRAQGILDEAEFRAQKTKLLG